MTLGTLSRWRNGYNNLLSTRVIAGFYYTYAELKCALAADHGSERACQNLQIEQDGVVLQVVQIYFRVDVHGFFRSPVDLPPPRHSRRYVEALALPRLVALDDRGQLGTR